MKVNETIYIGDGLYVRFNGVQLELRANDPENPTDVVYLEPEVAARLVEIITGDQDDA